MLTSAASRVCPPHHPCCLTTAGQCSPTHLPCLCQCALTASSTSPRPSASRGHHLPRHPTASSPLLLPLSILLLLIPYSNAKPLTVPDYGEQEAIETNVDRPVYNEVISYLHKYGYISSENPSLEKLRLGLQAYQAIAGIPVTGEIDSETVQATKIPRCARSDITIVPGGRQKRFVLAGASKWAARHFTAHNELSLKWFVSKYTNDMPKPVIRSTIQKAFELWAAQTDIRPLPHVKLRFSEATSEADADINILWTEGEHGDAFKFDGSGVRENVLAHTFFPDYKPQPLNGDIHFDDAEKWGTDPTRNTFFPYVLAHEIGHALGLQHSRSERAIMHPHYKNVPLDQIKLHTDDKCGINWNYAGSSNHCLFVWLMSEIVPINNPNVLGSAGNSRRKKSLSQHHHDPTNEELDRYDSEESKSEFYKKALQHAKLPQCSPENDVRANTEEKLMRQLHFPEDEARIYSEIACNFLRGLQKYREEVGPITDQLDEAFGLVHEFGPASERSVHKLFRRALHRRAQDRPSVLDRDHFDEKFFDNFFRKY